MQTFSQFDFSLNPTQSLRMADRVAKFHVVDFKVLIEYRNNLDWNHQTEESDN